MIISNFISGSEITDDIIKECDMTWKSRPNRLPESCGIRIEIRIAICLCKYKKKQRVHHGND